MDKLDKPEQKNVKYESMFCTERAAIVRAVDSCFTSDTRMAFVCKNTKNGGKDIIAIIDMRTICQAV
jgi:hypothetical protein